MALDAILESKRAQVRDRMRTTPLDAVAGVVVPSDRDFEAALRRRRPGFILEVKPASPSEGALRSPSDLEPVLAAYRRFADVVSVLTDAPFFGGSFELLRRVRAAISQPVLCKDFVIDPYQVYEARAHGADAVLLMLSVLDDAAYRACAEVAARLRVGVLTEVHTERELERAARLGARVIGLNSRNLATLEVDLNVIAGLAAKAPIGAILIAESGVRSGADVRRLREVVDGFLIGTTVMRAPDPGRVVRELVIGRTKVCGFTRAADADAAWEAGATHGGLIFAGESPRAVTLDQARAVTTGAALQWVGVFVNRPPAEIGPIADRLGLAAVQLHGEESAESVRAVRASLPPGCEVWKAVRVETTIPRRSDFGSDRVLLDRHDPARRGGTGVPFDWRLLHRLTEAENFVLSGGLTPENAASANLTPVPFLDICSGVESAPGIKDRVRLTRFFEARRELPPRTPR